jgi:hypothetical protein
MSNARDKANIPSLNFSSTGIDDNATSTAITIDSAESLGLGTTSPFNSRPGSFTISNEAPTIYFEDTNSSSYGVGSFLYQDGNISWTVGSRSGTGTSGSSERMRITSTGNVGIGTSSPSEKLEISDGKLLIKTTSGAAFLEIVTPGGSADSVINFGDSADNNVGIIAYEHDNNALKFITNTSERMRIDSSGRVGIGTTAPQSPLHVIGTNETASLSLTGGASNSSVTQINAVNATATVWNILEIRGQQINFDTVSLERMRIDSFGNVGIGTTAPDAKLSVNGVASFGDGTALLPSIANFGDLNTGMWFPAADTIAFSEGGAEAMRIDSSGNVGIGTTSPSSKFESVLATAGGNYPAFLQHTATSGTTRILRGQMSGHAPNNTDSVFITMGDNTATRFNVFSNGDVTNSNNSYTGISDIKLKEQIVDASSQWNDIKNIPIKKFKFKTDVATGDSDKHWRLGVIAQEVEKVSPSLVSETTDLDDDHNKLDTVTKSVKYSILYMKSVKALQEAMERIETLEAKVTALETNQP